LGDEIIYLTGGDRKIKLEPAKIQGWTDLSV